jgi:hypothetical protein
LMLNSFPLGPLSQQPLFSGVEQLVQSFSTGYLQINGLSESGPWGAGNLGA